MFRSKIAWLVGVVVAATAPAPLLAQDLYDRSVLRTIELDFAQTDWEDQLIANKAAGTQLYIAADMTVDGVTYPDVGVRYKGNSSYWIAQAGQKLPFNIDLDVFGVDQEVLGADKLVLNNQWADSSLMREVIAYRVLNEFTPSSRANFVKVVINGVNYGIYTNVEHVGGEMTERTFGDKDGFRYKAVPPDNWPDTITTPPPPSDLALQDLSGSLTRAQRAYELKNFETDPDAHLDVLAAIDALNNTSSNALVDTLDPLLDTDNAIWHLALNNAICSLDTYYESGRNYYLYEDTRHGRLGLIPWDHNMAFGNYGNAPPSLSPTQGASNANRPLLSNLVQGGVLRNEYLAHMDAIRRIGLDPVELIAEIDALQALIDAEVQIDTRLALNYSQWLNGVNSLKSFITSRHDFLESNALLDEERAEFLTYGHGPVAPQANEAVRFFAQAENTNDPVKTVFVYYRTNGVFQSRKLLDDGLNGDGAAGDGLFAREVSGGFGFGETVEYYFTAKTTNSGALRFGPDRASFAPLSFQVEFSDTGSDIVINEFVASNNSGLQDEAGQFEDWIELFNRGAAAVDLSGMLLSDDLGSATPWAIPAGTMLNSGETLLIWADKDLLDGPMHADFKLGSGGEEVALFAADGVTLLDYVQFGEQQSDRSAARLDDGGLLWVTIDEPTPDMSNNIDCGVRGFDAPDALRNMGNLALLGDPQPGATVTVQVSDFAPQQSLMLLIGRTPGVSNDPISGLSLLVPGAFQQLGLTTDTNGDGSLDVPIPADASLIGTRFYLQAGTLGANAEASQALEVVICP